MRMECETSTVIENLLSRKGYAPYCGNMYCKFSGPRSKWDDKKEQFTCKCGWVSGFEPEFIDKVKQFNAE